MEWVDTTFGDTYFNYKTPQKIPDSVIFETLYGEWVGRTFVGISVDDRKYRNFGLKQADYGRCYHFGKITYYFSLSQIPVRLDLEGFQKCEHPRKKQFTYAHFPSDVDQVETEEGSTFIKEWDEGGVDLFTLFEKFFFNHKKDASWVKEHDPQAKHFFLDQKWIDFEKNLPPYSPEIYEF